MTIIEAEICGQDIDGKACNGRATHEVSWPDWTRAEYPPATPQNPYRTFVVEPDGGIRYTAFYPHRVVHRTCKGCADALMAWSAKHLGPTCKAL